MKNSLKTLRIALASTALISVFAPNAQAENYTITVAGTVTNVTCTIGMYTAPTGGTANATLTLASVPLTTINGNLGTVAGSTAFYVGVPSGCTSSGTGGTTFNTGFSALNPVNGKAPNTGQATGVTIDLTSGSGATLKSLTLTATPPIDSAAATTQTGLAAATLANRQAFAARYYKTAATGTNVTAGTVSATIVATGYYP